MTAAQDKVMSSENREDPAQAPASQPQDPPASRRHEATPAQGPASLAPGAVDSTDEWTQEWEAVSEQPLEEQLTCLKQVQAELSGQLDSTETH